MKHQSPRAFRASKLIARRRPPLGLLIGAIDLAVIGWLIYIEADLVAIWLALASLALMFMRGASIASNRE